MSIRPQWSELGRMGMLTLGREARKKLDWRFGEMGRYCCIQLGDKSRASSEAGGTENVADASPISPNGKGASCQ